MEPIDFVVLWVDGADPEWQAEFKKFRQEAGMDTSEIRYRDWGTLPYLFRSIELYAPWVRKVHFITWGHLPSWLNTSHPKLNIVRHTDYIPHKWLPTFNSNVIELNLCRIDDLAEHFVLLNDDMFMTRPCTPEDFFRNGLPCDMARLSVVRHSSIASIILNNLRLINDTHSRSMLNKHIGKWIAPCYGMSNILKTLSLLPWSFYPAFYDSHQMQPYLKKDFKRAWELWEKELSNTSSHYFRSTDDVSHWLIRYDFMCRGQFVPRSMNDTKLLTLTDQTVDSIAESISQAKQRLLCINDSADIINFEEVCLKLQKGFEKLMPNRSLFEK